MCVPLQVRDDGIKDFDGIQGGEVVILPAFGASVEEMKLLNDRGVKIVDTTCPWVAKVCVMSVFYFHPHTTDDGKWRCLVVN